MNKKNKNSMNMNKARIGKNCSVQKENSVIYPKLSSPDS